MLRGILRFVWAWTFFALVIGALVTGVIVERIVQMTFAGIALGIIWVTWFRPNKRT